MIGDVPEGWKILPLKKLLNIQSGFAFDSKNFSKDKGKQLIRIRDLKNGFTTDVLFNGDYHNDYIVKSGSYLIGMDGDFICYEWKGIDSLLNQRVCRLHNFDSSINQKFIYYGINKELKKIHDVTSFVTVKHLSIKKINEIEFLVPPLPQQEKIVKVLDISSELIEKQKGLIAKYDLFLRSKFIEMFGDPAKNPMGWEIKTIEKIVKKEKGSIKRGPFGGALKKEIFVKEGYLVYEQFHALNNDFSMERYFINEEKFAELKGFEVKSGDIIISCSGVYLGKLAIVPPNNKKGIINQALLKISLDENKMKNILFTYIFTNVNFKKRFFGTHIGSGVPNFPPMSDFKKFKFISPPIKLQEKFVTIVEKIEIIKTKETKKLKQLETLHSSLMDKAFKGEIA